MTGLRERGRQQRRRAIVDAAQALFAEHGYAAVTCEHIAAAASVAPRTFFTHFPTKEDVVFADDADDLALMRARLDERGSTPVLAVVRELVGEWLTDDVTDAEVLRVRLVRESPTLAARNRRELERYEELLTGPLNAELGLPAADVRGGALAGFLVRAWERAAAGLLDGTLDRAGVPALLDAVVVAAQAALDALRTSREDGGDDGREGRA